jgi:hypothetical protein
MAQVPCGTVKDWESVDQLIDCQLLKADYDHVFIYEEAKLSQ